MKLGVQTNQLKVYLNLSRIWIILIKIYAAFNTKQDFWDYLNVMNIW